MMLKGEDLLYSETSPRGEVLLYSRSSGGGGRSAMGDDPLYDTGITSTLVHNFAIRNSSLKTVPSDVLNETKCFVNKFHIHISSLSSFREIFIRHKYFRITVVSS